MRHEETTKQLTHQY